MDLSKSPILRQTFQLRFFEKLPDGNIRIGRGTCFGVRVADRELLITAKHVMVGFDASKPVELAKECLDPAAASGWHAVAVKRVIEPAGDLADIIALELTASQSFGTIPLGSDDLDVGVPCLLLGHPDLHHFNQTPPKMTSSFAYAKSGDPIPFISPMTMIGQARPTRSESGSLLIVAGFSTPGMSGGPLIYLSGQTNEWTVGGVVVGTMSIRGSLRDDKGRILQDRFVDTNPGFARGHFIEAILQAMQKR